MSVNSAEELPLLSLCAFNFRPLTFMHPSWYEGKTTRLLRQLQKQDSELGGYDVYLLHKYRLHNHYCFDFSEPQSRLALAHSDVIERFIRLAGLVHLGGVIRRSIKASDVRKIRNELSIEEYNFAMNRAAFLMTHRRITIKDTSLEGLSAKVDELGVMSLCALFQRQPDALLKRVKLKLHKALSGYFDVDTNDTDEDTAKLLAMKLLPFCQQNEADLG